MKQPYENVYLGNFIFALGYYAGKEEKPTESIVHLVQQTPDDKTFNDLFVQWKGRNFIFEFKRNESKIKTELDKKPKKRLNDALNDSNNRTFFALSRKCHFLGYGVPVNKGNTNKIEFMFYADIHIDNHKKYSLDTFCETMMKKPQNTEFGLTLTELQKYLTFIGDICNTETDGCGGFILNVSNQGIINMVPFESIKLLEKEIENKPAPPAPTQTNTFHPR